MSTIVMFHLESDDPDHESGLSVETYDRVIDAILSVGGYDMSIIGDGNEGKESE